MFPLFRKNLLFLPSRCSSSSSQMRTSQVRNFLFRFAVLGFSSSSSSPPPPPQPHCNQHKEDKVRVSVWWDFDTCGVPSGVSFSKVAPSIMGALRTHGIKCPVDIQAYGNLYQLSEINQEILFLTGIDLYHVPGGRKHAHRYFMDWVFKNPPPAHLFLICGERDINFASAVSELNNKGYNILLACPPKVHDILCYRATIMWPWSSMLKGDFTGKYFNNYPPYWYVHSKVPLENPFSATEEPTSSQNAEIREPSSDIKLGGETRESVSCQVRKILRLYPNGISIGDLRAKLSKCDLPLGDRFYGHEKFSNFLVSIPHIQLLDEGEGKFCVHLIPSTTSDNDIVRSEETSPEILEKKTTSHNPFICNDYTVLENSDIANCKSRKAEDKLENPSRKKVDEVCRSPYSSPVDNSLVEKKRRDGSAETSSTFLFRSPMLGLSSSPLPPPPPPPPQPHCNQHKRDKVSVSVWWDVDNCGVPSGVSFWNVAPSIVAAVRANGIKGRIHIHAYHQFSTKVSKFDQRTLLATGMKLHSISGGKDDAYKGLLRDLSAWVTSHPPPEHHFLISDAKHDRDFSGILHRLRMNNYNILVACPGRGSDILRSATTIMWEWSSMLTRDDLIGKHFNYPPGGPFDSWYGDSKVPLENPSQLPRSSHLHKNVSSVDDDSKSFQSIRSQGKPIGEYVDGKSSFPSFKESNVHRPPNELEKTSLGSEKVVDVASALLSQVQLLTNDTDISKNSDNDNVRSEDVSPEILGKKTTSQNPSTCNDYSVGKQ